MSYPDSDFSTSGRPWVLSLSYPSRSCSLSVWLPARGSERRKSKETRQKGQGQGKAVEMGAQTEGFADLFQFLPQLFLTSVICA